MNIPNNVKIGDSHYEVKVVKRIYWFSPSVIGQIDYLNKKIKMKTFKDDKINQDTFFHELAHGLLKEMEFNHPKISGFRNNEEFVQELGLNLRKTFLDLLKKQRGR